MPLELPAIEQRSGFMFGNRVSLRLAWFAVVCVFHNVLGMREVSLVEHNFAEAASAWNGLNSLRERFDPRLVGQCVEEKEVLGLGRRLSRNAIVRSLTSLPLESP